MTTTKESDFGDKGALVVFTPSGKRARIESGTTILSAARQLGVDLDSVCGGRGICGRCQVDPTFGQFPKHGIESTDLNLNPQNEVEARYAKRRPLPEGRRLGCQCQILGDLVVDVPPSSQVHRQVVRKRAELRELTVDPVARCYYVEVEEPDMYHPSGDWERLKHALGEQWEMDTDRLTLIPEALARLQSALRAEDWKVTVIVHDDGRSPPLVLAVRSGFYDTLYGVAVDIGSTTIACHLVSLSDGSVLASSGVMNPQIRFGEDLMSRVSHVMLNPGGERELTRVVREAVNGSIRETLDEAKVEAEAVVEMTFVGNPVMHHLFLGLNPIELGGAPFALALNSALTVPAASLGLDVAPIARAYILPCIAGHVGADCAGVVLSETPHSRDELTLVVDVGTNAEIVLGNKDRVLACSSPTGPAFEGAQISCGQRAAPGAIERVRIDRETLEPRFRIIGCELWSNEEGFGEAAGKLGGVTGICGSGIIEVIAEMFLCGILRSDGMVDGSLGERSSRIRADGRTFAYLLHDPRIFDSESGSADLQITQNDVRAIQLAKAALYAGVRLLMDKRGTDKVDRIQLAGAFGSHIDVRYAMALGMVPDCALDKTSAAGNAAGEGARIALVNRGARDEIEAVVRGIEKIETAVEPRFQEHFVNAMAIPHAVDSFDELGKVLSLPKITGAQGGTRGTRRRARRPESKPEPESESNSEST